MQIFSKFGLFCASNIGKDPNLTFIIKCIGDHIEYRVQVFQNDHLKSKKPLAEFKEFERRFKFKMRFKYGWFHLKMYQMFQDLSRR